MINYIIGAVIALAMFLAIRKIVKDVASGGCGCGCSGCPSAKNCPSAHPDPKPDTDSDKFAAD